MENYLFITGGVVSSLGKGVTAAALAALFKARNLKVGIVKIDGYLNIDAGLMSPIEHGEVFVTHDGIETDLDIGSYERFLGDPISGRNSITSGRVFMEVINLERRGHYLGTTVQIVPHVTNHIKSLILDVGKGNDITLVEIGGVVGDIESMHFIEAARQLHLSLREKCAFLHLGLIPLLTQTNEHKTKPIQHSVRTLLSMGIQPDFVFCRSQTPLPPAQMAKVALFCNVDAANVVNSPHVDSKYEMPFRFAQQKIDELVLRKFGVFNELDAGHLGRWQQLQQQLSAQAGYPPLRIGFLRKYLTNADNYVSLVDSLTLSALQHGCSPRISYIDTNSEGIEAQLREMDCVVVPGGWGDTGVEVMIDAARFARENNVPFLGICYGFQLAMIEIARNVLGLAAAHTQEVAPDTPHPIVMSLDALIHPGHGNGQPLSPLLRLGTCSMHHEGESVFRTIYPSATVEERFRHRYTLNPQYRRQFEEAGVAFGLMGNHSGQPLFDAFQLTTNTLHIGVQYHPEFYSSVFRVNPVLQHFVGHSARRILQAAANK